MAKQKYTLNPGEKIVYKTESCVRHGERGSYTHILTITNQSVIWEKYGLFNNFKGIERFDYSIINQAIQGRTTNGEKQLELYMDNKVENFALQFSDEIDLKVLVMAINDQMTSNADDYDFNYYKNIITETRDNNRILELKTKIQDEPSTSSESGLEFAGVVAKNLLKSKNFSAIGVTKAVAKATVNQKKKGIFSGMVDEFLDDIGIRDLQDDFTEMRNEFREELGLKPKITHAERKELEELEEEKRERELHKQKNSSFQDSVNRQKAIINAKKNSASEPEQSLSEPTKISVKEQIELLQQVKNLFDAGILTQEEFDKKKQEILNN